MTKDEVIARIKLAQDRILVSVRRTIETPTSMGLRVLTGDVVAVSENAGPYRDHTVMYPRGQPFFEIDGDVFHIVNVQDILGWFIDDQG
jgi:hypothetical protein